MSRITHLTSLRLVGALCALLLATFATPAEAGYLYEARTVSEAERGQDSTMIVKGWIEGDQGRVEFEEAKGPQSQIFGSGYLITKDGGETVYLVNPDEQTYSEFDIGALFNSLGQMMEAMGGMMNMNFSDVEVELLSKEAGPSMLGHDTTRHQWRTAYVFEISVMGFKQRNEVSTVTDAWVTDDLEGTGYQAWLRKSPPTTGDDDLDAMIRAEAAQVQGFPLKTVSVTTMKNKKGKESTTTTTTEVTRLEETSVAADRFEVPAGYEKVEMLVPQLR